ncbi:hypothetical protein HmCmsJML240_03470 [Escherichia coli]|nr:hypothetical protein HmCmsJML240_03470 [Escherichia coli]
MTGGDPQFTADLHPGIHIHRPGNQRSVVTVLRQQSAPLNTEPSFVNIETFQSAAVHQRFPGGQGRSFRIDKTTAIAGNTGRISDHHFRTASGNLNKTIQPAGITAVDLIENDPCLPLCQPGITGNIAGQTGLCITVTVI